MSEVQDNILKELKKQNEQLEDLKQLQMLNERAMPMSSWWVWRQFKRTEILTLKPGDKTADPIVDDDKLVTQYGFLHSLDIQASSGDLKFNLDYHSLGRKFNISGTLSEFELADFSDLIPLPGDPVVIDRSSRGRTVPPQWTARVGPSFNIPFNTPFRFSLTNPSDNDIVIFSWDIFFIMLRPRGRMKTWINNEIKKGNIS